MFRSRTRRSMSHALFLPFSEAFMRSSLFWRSRLLAQPNQLLAAVVTVVVRVASAVSVIVIAAGMIAADLMLELGLGCRDLFLARLPYVRDLDLEAHTLPGQRVVRIDDER